LRRPATGVARPTSVAIPNVPLRELGSRTNARNREDRVAVAREAEHQFRKKVSWGVECADERALFTHIAAPVMTRLRQPERQVLDTLIAGGVARSRSDALAWCVRLVQKHTDDWLTELRDSLEHVQRVRAQGPDAGRREPPAEEE
jgi:hypothetical protein